MSSTPVPNFIKGIPLAVTFLTRFQMPEHWIDIKAMPWSTAYYPWVGWILGLGLGAPVLYLMTFVFNNPVQTAAEWLVPVIWLGLSYYWTRGFHFDGWCDCCDALMANTDPAGRRRILKDLHAGSGAVLGGAFLIAAKMLLLLALSTNCFSRLGAISPLHFALMLAFVQVLARFFVTLLAFVGRSSGGGISGSTIGRIPFPALLIAALGVLPGVLIFDPPVLSILVGTGAAVTFFWRMKAEAAFEGVNGDVLGANEESVELASLAVLTVFG